MPLEYWAHVMFGVVCLAAGAIVERTGQPVRVHLVQGGLVLRDLRGQVLDLGVQASARGRGLLDGRLGSRFGPLPATGSLPHR